MDFDGLVEAATDFFGNHTLWAVVAVLAVAALAYWKPKDMFKLAMAGLALGVLIYVFSFLVDLTSQGIDETRKFTNTPRIEVD